MVPRLADNLCRRETKQVCNTVNERNLCEIFYCPFKQRRLSDLEYLLEITVQWNPALWWPSFYDHLDILAWTKALWAVFLLKEPLLLWPIGDWINRVPLCSVEQGICKNFFTNLSSHDRKFMSRLCRLVNVALSRGTSNVELNISGTPMPTRNIGTCSSSPVSETLTCIFMQPVQWTTLKLRKIKKLINNSKAYYELQP